MPRHWEAIRLRSLGVSLAVLCLMAGTLFPADRPAKPGAGSAAGAGTGKAARPANNPAAREALRAAREARKARQVAQAEAAPPATAAAKTDSPPRAPRTPVDPQTVAAQVDERITSALTAAGIEIAPRCSDEDFLRRVSQDIAGVPPSPSEVTVFLLDPAADKRRQVVERLLASREYSRNWARYWHDVISARATETRPQFLFPALVAFDGWIEKQLAENRPWDEIATGLITATGDSRTDGQTGLIIAQRAEPDDIASETARLFLGIQLQCANCHDHPTDGWTRQQFHSLAAFFPRIQLRPKGEPGMPRTLSLELVSFVPGPGGNRGRGEFLKQITANPERFIRRLDKDGDQRLSREEAKQAPGGQAERLLDVADADKDGFLTADELRKAPLPPQNAQPGRGAAEYLMPDPQQPQSEGKPLDPVFFLGDLTPGHGQGDQERRQNLARYITDPANPWFARAFVNRIWGELLGEGFYMPVDDLGPERTARHPEALELLSAGFTASGYDMAWLFRAITATEAYQRQIRSRDARQTLPFAAATPNRLRADPLFDALVRVLGLPDGVTEPPEGEGMNMMVQALRLNNSPRGNFHRQFGFDPSTAPEEINGTIPQALFFMNSPVLIGRIRAGGQTRLNQILEQHRDNDEAVTELYLLVHAREPSERERATCREYLREVPNRREAFEDILWSLLNSTEFQTRR